MTEVVIPFVSAYNFLFWKFNFQLGAAAVNLVAGEKPADVYSEIAAR